MATNPGYEDEPPKYSEVAGDPQWGTQGPPFAPGGVPYPAGAAPAEPQWGTQGPPFAPVGASGGVPYPAGAAPAQAPYPPTGAPAGPSYPPAGPAVGSPYPTVGAYSPVGGYATQYSSPNVRNVVVGQPQPTYVQREPIPEKEAPDHMVLAVLVAVFCCLFFGIIAATKASSCKTARLMGDREKAKQFSTAAQRWILLGLLFGMLGIAGIAVRIYYMVNMYQP